MTTPGVCIPYKWGFTARIFLSLQNYQTIAPENIIIKYIKGKHNALFYYLLALLAMGLFVTLFYGISSSFLAYEFNTNFITPKLQIYL
jgi:hypothetical protein